jgi:DNA-binding CsgD family transcriptional regulator
VRNVIAPGVVGRERELSDLPRALDAVVADGPRALVVRGEAGIGKTTIWRAVLAVASARSMRILRCAPGELEIRLAYAALGDLLQPVLAEEGGALPAPQRRALEVALSLSDPAGAPPDQRAVAAAALAVVCQLAERGGALVLAVDDAQWLDTASQRVLSYVSRRLANLPVVLVVTMRGGEEVVPLGLDRALGGERLETVDVGPMTIEALGRLLHLRLGVALPRARLLEVHAASGGNPFFALEIVRALERHPVAAGEPLPVPASLRDLVADRLAGLPAGVRSTLLVVASLADPDLELLRAATPDADADVEAAVVAGVVDVEGGHVRFAHPLLASAVSAEAPPAARRDVHRRLAEVVGDSQQRARHLALGTVRPDARVAAILEEAARRAGLRAAPDTAAILAREAARLTPPARERERLERLLAAGEYHGLAGDPGQARTLLEDVIARAGAGNLRARAIHAKARAGFGTEDYRASVTLLERALPDAEDPALRVLILTDASAALVQAGELRRGQASARASLQLAERLGTPGPLVGALTNVAMADFLLGDGVRADYLQRAMAIGGEGDPGTALPPEFLWAALLKWTDRLQDARRRLEALYRGASERHEEHWLPSILYQLGELECWLGNFAVAADYAARARSAAMHAGQDEEAALYLDALTQAHTGNPESARRAATAAAEIAERSGNHRAVIRCLAVLGFLQLSLDDPHGAAVHLTRAVAMTHAVGYREPGILRFEHDAAEALIGAGALDEAERVVARLEAHGRSGERPWAAAAAARARALLRAASGELAEAELLLAEAARGFDGLGQRFEHARALLVLGGVQRRLRKKRTARDTLTAAAEIFDELGADRWGHRAREAIARIGGRAPGPAELSLSERQAAGLAARGYTNREIAEAMFVSIKTVERHLSHVFSKLGVHSRRELRSMAAPALADDEATDPATGR